MAIESRISKLAPQVQDVLRLAAVIGREFDFDTLHQACDLDEESLVEVLEVAEQAQLIGEAGQTPGREWRAQENLVFAHGLTMTALRESTSGLRRRRLHRRVAAVVRTLRPTDFEALAYHYGETGDTQNAITYARQAANRARSLYANEEAIRFYNQALNTMPGDHPDRFDLLAARSQVYHIIARREAQRSDVEEMLSLAKSEDNDARRCDALIALADLHLETEPPCATEPAQRAVTIAQNLQDPVRQGHALRRVGWEAQYRYDYDQSRDALEAAAAHFREANLTGEAAVCLHMLSMTLGSQGKHTAALEAAEQALALSRQAGNQHQEAISLRRLAIVHLTGFQYAKALPFAQAALALHRKLGARSEECKALNVLGVINSGLQKLEQAGTYFRQSLELGQAVGASSSIRAAVINLIWSYYRWQGEYQAALTLLEEQLAKARLARDEFLIGHLDSQRPFLLYYMGQYAEALSLAQRLFPTVEKLLGWTVQAMHSSLIGRSYAELGDYGQAYQHMETALEQVEDNATDIATLMVDWAHVALLEGDKTNMQAGLEQADKAISIFKDTDDTQKWANALQTAARLHLALGQHEAALIDSSEAIRLAAACPCPLHDQLYAHACALRATGHTAQANDYLQRAHERVIHIADRTKDEALRNSWLENVSINRQITIEWQARKKRS